MKLKFSIQEYQTEAVNSIVQIFNGQQIKKSNFTVAPNSILTQGTGNYLNLSEEQILENVRNIQLNNKLTRSTDLSKMNFTIEMETGTGKTYVYTKTILELNKKYGFTKFIIVVPSIAIKEGVYKSFKITEEHFRSLYDNVSYNDGVVEFLNMLCDNDIDNYLLSSGIKVFLEKVSISSYFKEIYATIFTYNQNFEVNGIEFLMSDKNKVTAIQQILQKNKIKDEDCSNVVYIGDGFTDYYAMKYIKEHGGTSIFVYKNFDNKDMKSIREKNVCDLYFEADFSQNSKLYSYVKKMCKIN